MIAFVEIPVGSGGGVRCVRCHGEPGAALYTPAGDVAAEIARAITAWRGRPGPNVALTGPDPFGHADLPGLVSAAVRGGAERLRVDTDAAALRSPVNAVGAVSAGVRNLMVTLLAGAPGLHDALAGQPGALDASIEGMAAFRSAAEAEGLPVCVTAVIPACRHNIHDLPATVGLALGAGVDRVMVRVEDGSVDLSGARAWLTAACDTGMINGTWVEVEGVPFCLLSGWGLHLADVVRHRAGAKSPVCGACGLDGVCGGVPVDAGADVLASLSPPAGAAELASAVVRVRGRGASDV